MVLTEIKIALDLVNQVFHHIYKISDNNTEGIRLYHKTKLIAITVKLLEVDQSSEFILEDLNNLLQEVMECVSKFVGIPNLKTFKGAFNALKIVGQPKKFEAKFQLYNTRLENLTNPLHLYYFAKDLNSKKQMMVKNTSEDCMISCMESIEILNNEEYDLFTGKGSRSTIYMGLYQNSKVAVKILKNVIFQVPTPEQDIELKAKYVQILKEVKSLMTLQDSPCISRCFGSASINYHLAIITEYHDNRTLFYWLHNACEPTEKETPKPLSFGFKLNTAITIAEGLKHMHGLKMAHCDIRSAKIMFDSKWNAKIIGLGNVIVDSGSKELTDAKSHMGSLPYRPPEYWEIPDSANIERRTGFAADVYSFGVLLGEIFTREQPWNLKNENEIKSILTTSTAPIWPFKSVDANHVTKLVKLCLLRDTRDRMTISKVLIGLKGIQLLS
eukprot:NODE_467_length_7071_cov_0.830752.p2 type:complete len:442 gc:universal NODE_467_length_7071_cov_0.830752:3576-2251(-)